MVKENSELGVLRELVYGRAGGATSEEVQRLMQLEGRAVATLDAPGPSEPDPADDAERPPLIEEAPSSAVPRHRRAVLWSLAASGLLLLGAGIAIGVGVASTQPPHPVAAVVPPNVEIFIPETVTYLGETDGLRVWSAIRTTSEDQCVIVTYSGAGNMTCESSVTHLAVEVPDPDRGLIRTVDVTFPENGEMPVLRVTHQVDEQKNGAR